MAERLSKSVADDLLARIARAEYGPGDTLPSEQQLGAMYGVGRNTVREAMQTLRVLGLVEVRPRLGARIVDSGARSALATAAISHLLRGETIDHLYDVRLILEPAAAERAAGHRTDEDLLAIKRALAHFRAAFELGVNVWEADIEFHQAVAEASGNPVLARLLAPMSDLLGKAREATGAIPEAVERALGEHEEIAAAIEDRSPRRARDAMEGHIRSAVWALEQARERDRLASDAVRARPGAAPGAQT
ncbi:FadR/GntR family transcriptional regulator [Jiangella rhizosphaerae]|uniref:FadR family transcriptional regulator n=1 Tax=Jiangella rhizosphaerae TaxID=2293569 RepID=A0A418KM28_9ACTN|nr:FadR/GntR family transcriptional regulator [Jiangella rhizosphaerae]RIQ18997.1 FadR family transcriptional regulator [Jiangella rhizosphaerae]